MKILVTGSGGFVGGRVAELAQQRGIACRRHRSLAQSLAAADDTWYQDLSAQADWRAALQGVDVVVHCAARVHQMREATGADVLALYRETNVAGTLSLARQAAEAGVRRLVFLSSVKVNGEFTPPGRPFTPAVSSVPADPYGLSKYEAEQGLWRIAAETGLEVVVIRPPLVYGPGVKANFRAMMRWVRRGLPLPLGAVNNRRSMVFVDNLADLVLLCARHPQAAGETFMVSDDHDVSTSQLLTALAAALGGKDRSWRCPPQLLRLAAKTLGKSAQADRVLGNLQVDISHTRQRLAWQPPVAWRQGLALTAQAFLAEQEDKGISHS